MGAEQFCEVLARLRGNDAVAQWRQLQKVMAPLAQAAIAHLNSTKSERRCQGQSLYFRPLFSSWCS